MFFTVTEDGKGIQKRRYYFSETFAAIGCAEYYKASGDESALLNARKYFSVAYKCFTGEIKTTPKFNPETTNVKALSPVMIMLSTAQTMRSVDKDNYEYYNGICKQMLNEILNGGYLTEKALLESVTTSGEFSNTPSGRVVNPGHSMEAAWFIMLEGLITGDTEVIKKGKEIIDITYPLGWAKNGGIIAFTDCLGKPAKALEWDMYLWWPQCEAMIANLMAYKIFGEEKYLNDYNRIKDFAFKHFADNKNGEWYGYLHYDGTVANRLKGNIFKGPFHLPRMLMLIEKLEKGENIL